jgi:hypothetical protein
MEKGVLLLLLLPCGPYFPFIMKGLIVMNVGMARG